MAGAAAAVIVTTCFHSPLPLINSINSPQRVHVLCTQLLLENRHQSAIRYLQSDIYQISAARLLRLDICDQRSAIGDLLSEICGLKILLRFEYQPSALSQTGTEYTLTYLIKREICLSVPLSQSDESLLASDIYLQKFVLHQ